MSGHSWTIDNGFDVMCGDCGVTRGTPFERRPCRGPAKPPGLSGQQVGPTAQYSQRERREPKARIDELKESEEKAWQLATARGDTLARVTLDRDEALARIEVLEAAISAEFLSVTKPDGSPRSGQHVADAMASLLGLTNGFGPTYADARDEAENE